MKEEEDKETKSNIQEKENISQETESSLTKLRYIILLYVFYLFSGLFNEKLTKTLYEYKDNENNIKKLRFKYPSISLCILSFFSFIISSYMSKYMIQRRNNKSYFFS